MELTRQHTLTDTDAYPPPPPQAWDTHVLIPITQNILGGVAVGGLGMIAVIAYTGLYDKIIDFYNAGVWCGLAGSVVTCAITIVRFFGDDLGIVLAAYRAGQQSRDAQIAALELELRASYDAQSAAEAKGSTTDAISERQRQMFQAGRDAAKLIEIDFQGDSISRDHMKVRGMGQRNWERANWLLKAAGVMDGDGFIVATNPAQALKAVNERVQAAIQGGDKFVPKW